LREDINCFDPNFGEPMITVSVCIENLMWKGSDYKRMRDEILFNPPVRESGQTKAMFKGINRGVIAGIYIKDFNDEVERFL
jgi:dihydroorotase-like cyclic amidohydrolase